MNTNELVEFFRAIKFVDIIEFFGFFAFVVSGIRLASIKNLDWFGAYVVGFVTASGGGTIRDLCLNTTPFWMLSSFYSIITILALVFTIIFKKYISKLSATFMFFDSIGLGLFVVVGVEKTLEFEYPIWTAVIMATITGAFGGIIRDILIQEIPTMFTEELYAIACIIGALIYCGLDYLGVYPLITQLVTASSVFAIRVIANKYKIKLPTLSI